MIIYDRTGWTVISWAGPLPQQQISTEAIVPLGRLFQDNRALLGQSPESERQVEVYNNTYRISILNGKVSMVYTFDAMTGALIPSP
jgi:hypothetical protein